MRFRLPVLLALVLCALAVILATVLDDSGAAPATPAVIGGENAPSYTSDGRLKRPEGWEEWIFVGAALGLSYSEQGVERRQGLHHVYLVPEAYQHYARTGAFPEGTMLVLEIYRPGEPVTPARQGVFAGERTAVEVALKDSQHFPDEGWAYFDFSNGLAEAASALPPDRCYSCHAQHADDDNVFTQFYPVLRRLKDAG